MRVTNSPYETLIQQMVEVERAPQYALMDERAQQKRFKGVISDFDSKLSALHKALGDFTDPYDNLFEARSVTLSEDAPFAATAKDDAALGSHSLRIDRLAQTDTRLTRQYTNAGTSLRSFFDANGAQTFSVTVASPTDADPDNRVAVDVTVDPTGTTDQDILKEISSAVNQAMADAASAGTIKREERASMSLINETSGTSRLSLRSGDTGFASRLEFGDSAAGLLAALDLNSTATVAEDGTGGGMVYDVGTSETDSMLNSKVVLDGLALYRSSNTIDDAVQGVELKLTKADGVTTDFSVGADTEGIKEDVNAFIEKYNDILSYIEQKSSIDGDAGTRGDFASEYSYKALRYNMRTDLVGAVASQPDGAPRYLTDLGIEIQKDGTLKLADEDQLTAAVEKDPQAVQSLFGHETDGYATKLEQRLDAFVGFNGLLANRKKNIDSDLRSLETEINGWDDKMERRTEQLRAQFGRVQQTLTLLQGQQGFLMGFMGQQSFF